MRGTGDIVMIVLLASAAVGCIGPTDSLYEMPPLDVAVQVVSCDGAMVPSEDLFVVAGESVEHALACLRSGKYTAEHEEPGVRFVRTGADGRCIASFPAGNRCASGLGIGLINIGPSLRQRHRLDLFVCRDGGNGTIYKISVKGRSASAQKRDPVTGEYLRVDRNAPGQKEISLRAERNRAKDVVEVTLWK